jgi:phosphotriesterase-related protein
VQALAQAQRRTGAPLLVPLPGGAGSDAVAALQVLVECGAESGAIVCLHAQNMLGGRAAASAALRELLGLGACLCFDGLGDSWCVAGPGPAIGPDAVPAPEHEVAAEIASLAAAGYGARLMLSNGLSSRLQLQACGGAGLRHVERCFAPRLLRLGMDEPAVRATLRNGERLLRWSLPAAAAPRRTKPWECSACHRVFEEAANEAEALPTDRVYYEKFAFRYCGTPCLAAHREAKYQTPFACAPPKV